MYGRAFLHSDVPATGSAQVAIVSQPFAKTFWGNNSPVGKVVVTPDNRRIVVIGIAAGAYSERFSILDGPRLYTLQDAQSRDGHLFCRFNGDAAPVAASIEAIVRSMDASQTDSPTSIWDFLETNATSMRPLAKIILFMA